MTTWSKTNIPDHVTEATDGRWAIVDAAGLRIDWPLIDTEVEAWSLIVDMLREQMAADEDARSEARGCP